jgi:hypothetical protein
MNSRKPFIVGMFTLALSFAAMAPAHGAEAAPSDPQVQDLEEVRVHGQRLSVRIERAEDAFFQLYNILNDNDDYRMICGQRALHPGSRIMTRICVPGFIADRGVRGNLLGAPRVGWGTCVGEFPQSDGRVALSGPCIDGGYEPPPLALFLLERSNAWGRHMMKVIRSDARLQEMAGELDQLHREMDTINKRFVKVHAGADGQRTPNRRSAGPRAL